MPPLGLLVWSNSPCREKYSLSYPFPTKILILTCSSTCSACEARTVHAKRLQCMRSAYMHAKRPHNSYILSIISKHDLRILYYPALQHIQEAFDRKPVHSYIFTIKSRLVWCIVVRAHLHCQCTGWLWVVGMYY